jgi:Fe-Mn family superoxide dismutase
MAFTLPGLPYAYEALEPFIDAETMKIHHDKHHAAYITNLGKALEGSEFASWPVEKLVRDLAKLPEASRTAVRNNGGGHYNHSLFWTMMAPGAGGKPSGSLATALERDLGGFDAFKADLTKAALGRFGSGWAWLVLLPASGAGKKLAVVSTANQDSPLTDGQAPLVGVDVWEHAYYLKYQNRRADYVEAFFNVVDWKAALARFEAAMG